MSPVPTVTKPENKSAPATERWVSLQARSHRVTGLDKAGVMQVVPFENFVCELDLSNSQHRSWSEALRNSGRDGQTIVCATGEYDGDFSEVGVLTKLRDMLGGDDEVSRQAGMEKLRALFTKKELADAGLPYFEEDENKLIVLALKLKKNIGK